MSSSLRCHSGNDGDELLSHHTYALFVVDVCEPCAFCIPLVIWACLRDLFLCGTCSTWSSAISIHETAVLLMPAMHIPIVMTERRQDGGKKLLYCGSSPTRWFLIIIISISFMLHKVCPCLALSPPQTGPVIARPAAAQQCPPIVLCIEPKGVTDTAAVGSARGQQGS